MASNVADSTRIWNCKVKNPSDVVGPLGDLQHMKSYLGDGETLDAGMGIGLGIFKYKINFHFITPFLHYISRRNGLDYRLYPT